MSHQLKAFFCDVIFDNIDHVDYDNKEINYLLDNLGDNLNFNDIINSSSGLQGAAPPPSSKSPNQLSFQQQLNELINTEKSYLRRLSALKFSYSDPLRQFSKHKDTQIINQFDSNVLFSNIDNLLNVHKNFLSELEFSNDLNIGDICLSHMPNFNCYHQYYFNIQNSINLFKDLLKKKSFVEFIDRTKLQTTGINNIGLRELLMEPVQRIPRYILLFQGMMNYLDQNNKQRQKLYQSLEIASKIASCESDEVTKRANLMHTLQRNINNFPPNLISHNRTLIDCLDINDLPTPMTGHIEEPLPCTIFLFNDKLMLVKRPSLNSRGRKLSGLDDLDISNGKDTLKFSSFTPSKFMSKNQLTCKTVVDLSDVTVTDLSNDDFGVVFQASNFNDADDERFNRPSKLFQVTQVSFSPSEPLSTNSPKSRFISKVWKQQALIRATGADVAKISIDTLPLMSGAIAGGRGHGQARLYWSIYENREKWFKNKFKSKAVLHIDGNEPNKGDEYEDFSPNSIPVGEGLNTPPMIVIRAQPLSGRLCRLVTEFSDPHEILNEIVNIEDVFTRVVWHIQAQGLYDYKPSGVNSTINNRKRERAPSSPTKLKFESISKGFFNNSKSSKLNVPIENERNVNGTNSHRRTRSMVSKSSGTLNSQHSSALFTSTPPTSLDGNVPSPLPKSPNMVSPERLRNVKRKQTPAADEAEREAAREALENAKRKEETERQENEKRKTKDLKDAEEEVDLLNYRDKVRQSYLERPRSVPPPSTNHESSEEEQDDEEEVDRSLHRMNTRSSLATVGNYSIRSEATTSVPIGSDTEARSSSATYGNGSTISNSTSVDLRFTENDEDENVQLEREHSYISGGRDEARFSNYNRSDYGSGTYRRRRSNSLPSLSNNGESVSSSLIPPDPAFTMSRQPTTSSMWSRSTGTSLNMSLGSFRKPLGPRDQMRSPPRDQMRSPVNRARTPKIVEQEIKMNLQPIKPLQIPAKNINRQKSVDKFDYTSAEWQYAEGVVGSDKENDNGSKRKIDDIDLEDRKLRMEELKKLNKGDIVKFVDLLLDGFDKDQRALKRIRSDLISDYQPSLNTIDNLINARTLDKDLADIVKTNAKSLIDHHCSYQLHQANVEKQQQIEIRNKEEEAKMRIQVLQNQLSECKNEISVLYESFNEELDGMYEDANLSRDEALLKMGNDLKVAKSQRNEYLQLCTMLKMQIENK